MGRNGAGTGRLSLGKPHLFGGGLRRIFPAQTAQATPMLLFLSWLICLLPMRWALRLGRALAWVWFYILPIRRGVALANVRRILAPQKSAAECRAIVRRCFTLQVLSIIDTLRAPRLTAAISEATVHRHGMEDLQAALAEGKGVVLATAHYGSMELAGYGQAIRGLPFTVIVRKVSWKAANDFITRIRERTGVELIAARRSKTTIDKTLRQNKIVTFFVDQHMPKHRAIVCCFLGQVAATSPAPTRFSLQTGAPLFVGRIVRRGFTEHHDIYFQRIDVLEPPVTKPLSDSDAYAAILRHNSERINRIFEQWIHEHPDHWLWLHRRWKVHDNPQGWQIPDDLRPLLDSSGSAEWSSS